MADTFQSGSRSCADTGEIKEAVCIDAYRVYDSCGDKDCLEDLQVYFIGPAQSIIDRSTNVRIKDVDVITVYVDLDPVPFHRGFYTVDMTFFFDVELEAFMGPSAMGVCVKGLSIFNKRVILYGSEGNVKIFSSDSRATREADFQDFYTQNLPKASVQVAKPIGLSAKLKEKCKHSHGCCKIPDCICERFGGEMPSQEGERDVFVSIGVFTIVQIERNVQMLIPTYDFCVPEKECVASSTDDPCEIFSRIDFPKDEFFPPKVSDLDDNCGCGCGCN